MPGEQHGRGTCGKRVLARLFVLALMSVAGQGERGVAGVEHECRRGSAPNAHPLLLPPSSLFPRLSSESLFAPCPFPSERLTRLGLLLSRLALQVGPVISPFAFPACAP